jgi:hypothetical protein
VQHSAHPELTALRNRADFRLHPGPNQRLSSRLLYFVRFSEGETFSSVRHGDKWRGDKCHASVVRRTLIRCAPESFCQEFAASPFIHGFHASFPVSSSGAI